MNNLINQQVAFDLLMSRARELTGITGDLGGACVGAAKLIKSLPSADKPTGKWTNVGVLTVHCSNCKSEFHELEAMNYCPNCGANMRGEK